MCFQMIVVVNKLQPIYREIAGEKPMKIQVRDHVQLLDSGEHVSRLRTCFWLEHLICLCQHGDYMIG